MNVEYVVIGTPYESSDSMCRMCHIRHTEYTVFLTNGQYNQFCGRCTIEIFVAVLDKPKNWE